MAWLTFHIAQKRTAYELAIESGHSTVVRVIEQRMRQHPDQTRVAAIFARREELLANANAAAAEEEEAPPVIGLAALNAKELADMMKRKRQEPDREWFARGDLVRAPARAR